ncbi:MAG: hypothetical protein KAY32_18085 [Candidatus Eisenbacteria sp.]|nr:hypothetical protein [Candidatus Eisenbacteria bacterium]
MSCGVVVEEPSGGRLPFNCVEIQLEQLSLFRSWQLTIDAMLNRHDENTLLWAPDRKYNRIGG